MTNVAVVVAVVLAGWALVTWVERRGARAVRERPVTPWQMQIFRAGDMPHHEDTPMLPAEEDAFKAIAEAEHDWIGDAVKGRAEDEEATG